MFFYKSPHYSALTCTVFVLFIELFITKYLFTETLLSNWGLPLCLWLPLCRWPLEMAGSLSYWTYCVPPQIKWPLYLNSHNFLLFHHTLVMALWKENLLYFYSCPAGYKPVHVLEGDHADWSVWTVTSLTADLSLSLFHLLFQFKCSLCEMGKWLTINISLFVTGTAKLQ